MLATGYTRASDCILEMYVQVASKAVTYGKGTDVTKLTSNTEPDATDGLIINLKNLPPLPSAALIVAKYNVQEVLRLMNEYFASSTNNNFGLYALTGSINRSIPQEKCSNPNFRNHSNGPNSKKDEVLVVDMSTNKRKGPPPHLANRLQHKTLQRSLTNSTTSSSISSMNKSSFNRSNTQSSYSRGRYSNPKLNPMGRSSHLTITPIQEHPQESSGRYSFSNGVCRMSVESYRPSMNIQEQNYCKQALVQNSPPLRGAQYNNSRSRDDNYPHSNNTNTQFYNNRVISPLHHSNPQPNNYNNNNNFANRSNTIPDNYQRNPYPNPNPNHQNQNHNHHNPIGQNNLSFNQNYNTDYTNRIQNQNTNNNNNLIFTNEYYSQLKQNQTPLPPQYQPYPSDHSVPIPPPNLLPTSQEQIHQYPTPYHPPLHITNPYNPSLTIQAPYQTFPHNNISDNRFLLNLNHNQIHPFNSIPFNHQLNQKQNPFLNQAFNMEQNALVNPQRPSLFMQKLQTLGCEEEKNENNQRIVQQMGLQHDCAQMVEKRKGRKSVIFNKASNNSQNQDSNNNLQEFLALQKTLLSNDINQNCASDQPPIDYNKLREERLKNIAKEYVTEKQGLYFLIFSFLF